MDDQGIVTTNNGETKRPRGRPKITDLAGRRADIIAAGTDLLIDFGYANTTVDLIAARCSISKRTFYDFFESKGALLHAALKARCDTIFFFPDGGNDLPLDEMLASIFFIDESDGTSAAAMRDYFLLEVGWEAADQVSELRDELNQARSTLASWFKVQAEKGRIELIDADAAATMLLGTAFGSLAIDRTGADQEVRAKRAKAYLRSSLRIFANGLAV